ncbi:MAG: hypothetical protein WCI57_03710 [Candidatus Berkelbacteria bacterium]
MNIKKVFLIIAISAVLLMPRSVVAADSNTLSVSTVSGSKLGYSLYWDSGQGNVKIERSSDGSNFATIGETTLNYYVDFNVLKDVSYTYRVNIGGKIVTSNASNLSAGASVISDIRIEPGSTNKAEASVVLYFNTDKLSKSQIYYGDNESYTSQTEIDNSLNQSHTILLEKLKPSSTYHFKIKILDINDEFPVESADQLFTTPSAPNDTSILQIIIKALTDAFSGFASWFAS